MDNPTPPEEARNPLSDFFLFSVGAVISLAVAIWFGRVLWTAIQARSWPTVPCKITRFDAPVKVKGKYELRLAYDYSFENTRYESYDYRFDANKTRDSSVFAKFSPGAEAVCYVNPKKPTQAVLDRSITFGDMTTPGLLLLLSVGCAACSVHSVKLLKKSRNAEPDAAADVA